MFRHEMLDAYVFESFGPVREISVAWIQEYNEERSLDMLDGRPSPCFGPTKPDVLP